MANLRSLQTAIEKTASMSWLEKISFYVKLAHIAVSGGNTMLPTRLGKNLVIRGRNLPGYGGRGIYLLGDRVEPEIAVVRRLLKPGDVFIDVGSAIGVYSLIAAELVGSEGIVLALDPNPELACMLIENANRNGLQNIRMRIIAASNNCGERTLWLNAGEPNVFSLNRLTDAPGRSVLAVSLDELMGWERLSRVNYLKIDAEGEEPRILAGEHKLVSTFRPYIQREYFGNRISQELLPDYRQFQLPDSFNRLHIPAEDIDCITLLQELGAKEVEE